MSTFRPIPPLAVAFFVGTALVGGGLIALAEPPKGGYASDPTPVPSRKQWSIEVAAHGPKVSVDRVTSVTVDRPTETVRVVGRFALELYVGQTLLDRVRFNVPLVDDEAPGATKGPMRRPRFDENVTTKISVRMADNGRGAYLLVVDRRTGETQKLEWPPQPDGHLIPWKSGLSDAAPGDAPGAGVKVVSAQDGGVVFSGARASDAGAHPSDAGHDAAP